MASFMFMMMIFHAISCYFYEKMEFWRLEVRYWSVEWHIYDIFSCITYTGGLLFTPHSSALMVWVGQYNSSGNSTEDYHQAEISV
jgi:hypothetical protein